MNRPVLIAAAAAAGLAGAFLLAMLILPALRSDDGDRFAQCREGAVAEGADIGGPFELVNAAGETVTDADVITEPALIYFGYTSCPDVCPMDVDRNAAAVDILEERGISVKPVFITVDPDRDTPEVVGDFAANMHPRMEGLTGSAAQTKAASTAYRTYFKLHNQNGEEDYLVDHSTFSYLVLPETGFVDYFRREVAPEKMADRIGCFVEQM